MGQKDHDHVSFVCGPGQLLCQGRVLLQVWPLLACFLQDFFHNTVLHLHFWVGLVQNLEELFGFHQAFGTASKLLAQAFTIRQKIQRHCWHPFSSHRHPPHPSSAPCPHQVSFCFSAHLSCQTCCGLSNLILLLEPSAASQTMKGLPGAFGALQHKWDKDEDAAGLLWPIHANYPKDSPQMLQTSISQKPEKEIVFIFKALNINRNFSFESLRNQ